MTEEETKETMKKLMHGIEILFLITTVLTISTIILDKTKYVLYGFIWLSTIIILVLNYKMRKKEEKECLQKLHL